MADFGLSRLGIDQESDRSSGRSAVKYNCLKFLLLAKWTSLYIITGSKACWKEAAGPVHLPGDCLLHSSPQCLAVVLEPAQTLSFGVFQLNLSRLRLCSHFQGFFAVPWELVERIFQDTWELVQWLDCEYLLWRSVPLCSLWELIFVFDV